MGQLKLNIQEKKNTNSKSKWFGTNGINKRAGVLFTEMRSVGKTISLYNEMKIYKTRKEKYKYKIDDIKSAIWLFIV